MKSGDLVQGKYLRAGKIWGKDGKAMLVAADHGLMLGPIPGTENLESTLRKVIKGGADGILISPGQAMRISHLFHGKNAPAMLIRGDYLSGFRTHTYTLPNEQIHQFSTISPKKALALGASAMVVYYLIGRPEDSFNDEATNLRVIAKMAEESELVGLPFIIEPMPYGPRVTGSNYIDLLRISIRIAEEIGADGIKIPYSGDPDSFREIVHSVDIPVFILGGAKSKTYREAVELVEEAIGAGARGTVFGRQLLQAADPEVLARYLMQVVHGKASTKDLFATRVNHSSRLKILPDRCTGCQICSMACSQSHAGDSRPNYSAIKVQHDFPKRFKFQTCTHCYQCIPVCPQSAISSDPTDGHIKIDPEKCDLCIKFKPQGESSLLCVQTCPMHVIQPPTGDPNIPPDGMLYSQRIPLVCDFCKGIPECIEWCPNDAIILEEWPHNA
jgi:class I fructose-bisphosphate aldolase